jgi:hypothetical protein
MSIAQSLLRGVPASWGPSADKTPASALKAQSA